MHKGLHSHKLWEICLAEQVGSGSSVELTQPQKKASMLTRGSLCERSSHLADRKLIEKMAKMIFKRERKRKKKCWLRESESLKIMLPAVRRWRAGCGLEICPTFAAQQDFTVPNYQQCNNQVLIFQTGPMFLTCCRFKWKEKRERKQMFCNFPLETWQSVSAGSWNCCHMATQNREWEERDEMFLLLFKVTPSAPITAGLGEHCTMGYIRDCWKLLFPLNNGICCKFWDGCLFRIVELIENTQNTFKQFPSISINQNNTCVAQYK